MNRLAHRGDEITGLAGPLVIQCCTMGIHLDSELSDQGASITVENTDSSLDPVGPCIGMRGSRVQAVVGELQGEKIDIIQWSPDPAAFIVNALAPAEVAKVVLDEETNRIEVVVPDEQLSLAIGRRGQNVRLASQLSGWDIDILTEDEESERRQEEFHLRSTAFIESLDVEEVIAHLLVAEGFTSVEEVGFVPIEELAGIEGFDEDIAEELRGRARAFIAERDKQLDAERKTLGVTDELAAFPGVGVDMVVTLGKQGIKTLDDLADLAGDELLELGDPSVLHAEVTLDEQLLGILDTGAPVGLRTRGAPGEELVGTIVRVSQAPSGGNLRSTYRVVVAVDNADGSLRPGMIGSARFDAGDVPAAQHVGGWLSRMLRIDFWI